MQFLYTFIISFIFIFFSELGDKTQILVLSLSGKHKAFNILLGVVLGTLLSHGLAITFGSQISNIGNIYFITILKFITYITFLVFGFFGFWKLKKINDTPISTKTHSTSTIIKFINSLTKNCILIVALTIAIGELGDKTFLASLGLGIQYPLYRFSLILGSIFGMVISDSIAIFFGKIISKKVSSNTIDIISNTIIDIISNTIFIIFGIVGIFSVLI